MKLSRSTSVLAASIALLGLSACNTTTIEGPITLSQQATNVYLTYQEEADPKAMAVTVDGAFATFAYCAHAECRNGIQTAVIRFCSSGRDEAGITTAPCQLFALGDKIVWNGEVTLHSQ